MKLLPEWLANDLLVEGRDMAQRRVERVIDAYCEQASLSERLFLRQIQNECFPPFWDDTERSALIDAKCGQYNDAPAA